MSVLKWDPKSRTIKNLFEKANDNKRIKISTESKLHWHGVLLSNCTKRSGWIFHCQLNCKWAETCGFELAELDESARKIPQEAIAISYHQLSKEDMLVMRSWQQKNKRADWFIVLSVWGVYSDCLRVVCLILLTLSTISCYSVKPPWPTVSFYIPLGRFLATDHLVFQTHVHFQKIEDHIPKWPIFPVIKGPLLIGDLVSLNLPAARVCAMCFWAISGLSGTFRSVGFFRILPAWQGILESRDLKTTIPPQNTTTYAEETPQSQHKPNCGPTSSRLLPLLLSNDLDFLSSGNMQAVSWKEKKPLPLQILNRVLQ